MTVSSGAILLAASVRGSSTTVMTMFDSTGSSRDWGEAAALLLLLSARGGRGQRVRES